MLHKRVLSTQKYKITEPDSHAVMLETVDVVLATDKGTAPFMHLSSAEWEIWMYLELVQLRLTAWMFKVGSGQA